MSDPVSKTTIARVQSPPNVWAHLNDASTQADVDAADAEHEAWMQSPAGVLYLDWDRRVCEYANASARPCNYRQAMEALNVEFV